MATDFFKKFVNDLGEPDTAVAAEGMASSEFTGFVDTGSYTLNAVISGSIFGGMPDNKVLAFAGDPATGKTFFTLAVIKKFLSRDARARVFYFDTESAVTNKMMEDTGIDPTRVAKSEPDSIERFRSVALKVLDEYGKIPKDERFPLMVVLDSLSALPSSKEVGDVREGKDSRDMTKAGLIKGAFRVLRLKMAKVNVPFVVTNHVYAIIGAYVPTKELGGGSGLKYAGDTILLLSKSKEKDADKAVVGNVIHLWAYKSRLSRENVKIDTRIMYDGGLDPYYGLLPIAEAAGIVKKDGKKYVWPDGTKVFERAILNNPKKFFTDDVLKSVEDYVAKHFKYIPGGAPAIVDDEDGEDEGEDGDAGNND